METNILSFALGIFPPEIVIELEKGCLSGEGDRGRPFMVTVDPDGNPVGQFSWFKDLEWKFEYGRTKPVDMGQGHWIKGFPRIRMFFDRVIWGEVEKYPDDYFVDIRRVGEFWRMEYGDDRSEHGA